MVSEPTLQQHHFDWLGTEPDRRDTQTGQEICGVLESLWRQILSDLRSDGLALGTINVGKLTKGDDHAWAQTDQEHAEGRVNLTIEVSAQELSFNVVGWFDEQFKKLSKWLGRLDAQKMLAEMPDYSLVLFARLGAGSDASGFVFKGAPGVERERHGLSETSPALLPIRITTFKSGLNKPKEKPGAHLRRSWAPSEAIRNDELVDELENEARRWIPVLDQINLTQS